jgi:Insect cuticle protein
VKRDYGKDADAVIVEGQVAEYFTNTGYNYNFKTSNDIVKQEVSNLDKDVVTGFYEYVDPEGEPHTTRATNNLFSKWFSFYQQVAKSESTILLELVSDSTHDQLLMSSPLKSLNQWNST